MTIFLRKKKGIECIWTAFCKIKCIYWLSSHKVGHWRTGKFSNLPGKHDAIKTNKHSYKSIKDHLVPHNEELFQGQLSVPSPPISKWLQGWWLARMGVSVQIHYYSQEINLKNKCLQLVPSGIIFIYKEQNMNYIFKICKSTVTFFKLMFPQTIGKVVLKTLEIHIL